MCISLDICPTFHHPNVFSCLVAVLVLLFQTHGFTQTCGKKRLQMSCKRLLVFCKIHVFSCPIVAGVPTDFILCLYNDYTQSLSFLWAFSPMLSLSYILNFSNSFFTCFLFLTHTLSYSILFISLSLTHTQLSPRGKQLQPLSSVDLSRENLYLPLWHGFVCFYTTVKVDSCCVPVCNCVTNLTYLCLCTTMHILLYYTYTVFYGTMFMDIRIY